jgi:hypothetical protein
MFNISPAPAALAKRANQMVRANHTPTPECNSLRCSVPCYRKPFDSISYGSGITQGSERIPTTQADCLRKERIFRTSAQLV